MAGIDKRSFLKNAMIAAIPAGIATRLSAESEPQSGTRLDRVEKIIALIWAEISRLKKCRPGFVPAAPGITLPNGFVGETVTAAGDSALVSAPDWAPRVCTTLTNFIPSAGVWLIHFTHTQSGGTFLGGGPFVGVASKESNNTVGKNFICANTSMIGPNYQSSFSSGHWVLSTTEATTLYYQSQNTGSAAPFTYYVTAIRIA